MKHIVPLRDGHVHLSDHDRLHAGNIRFDEGWDLRRFVQLLDGLVFFWPGDENGPSKQGASHFDRYLGEGQTFVVMRAPTAAVVALNSAPMLSTCNSGAPRHNPSSGKQPRGAGTFRALSEFSTDEEFVEVVFMDRACLPPSSQQASTYSGPWQPLFGNSQQK